MSELERLLGRVLKRAGADARVVLGGDVAADGDLVVDAGRDWIPRRC